MNAWAVGDSVLPDGTESRTLVEHWNGTSWVVIPSPNLATGPGTANTLTGVTALSGQDIWATGWAIDPLADRIVLLFEHWNGHTWSTVTGPTTSARFQFATAIDAVSAHDVWAVGYDDSVSPRTTVSAHWDGTVWSIVATPNLLNGSPPDNQLQNVTAIGPNNVWAVGYENNIQGLNKQKTLIEHWNGTVWRIVASPNPNTSGGELFGVTALSATDVWAVGESRNFDNGVQRSLTMQWNGTTWTVAQSPNGILTTTPLDAAAVNPGTVWAVGGTEHPGQCCLRTLVLQTTQG